MKKKRILILIHSNGKNEKSDIGGKTTFCFNNFSCDKACDMGYGITALDIELLQEDFIL